MEGTLIRTTSFASINDGNWANRIYQRFASRLGTSVPNRQEILECARVCLFDTPAKSVLLSPYKELLAQCEHELSKDCLGGNDGA